MDDLNARFLPQFVQLARTRLAHARTAAGERDAAATLAAASGMHQLAGEAGLLGLSDVVPLARDCERNARSLIASRAESDAERLIASLAQLEQIIEDIAGRNAATHRSRGAD
jgi:HPt (histidine-containing phosphotransfer) domain-containing protein